MYIYTRSNEKYFQSIYSIAIFTIIIYVFDGVMVMSFTYDNELDIYWDVYHPGSTEIISTQNQWRRRWRYIYFNGGNGNAAAPRWVGIIYFLI